MNRIDRSVVEVDPRVDSLGQKQIDIIMFVLFSPPRIVILKVLTCDMCSCLHDLHPTTDFGGRGLARASGKSIVFSN